MNYQENTHTVKNSDESVAEGMILRMVALPTKTPQVRTPTRIPLVSISQHIGATKTVKVMVPQFAIIATVSEPQPEYAALTLSLRGPHKFHWKH